MAGDWERINEALGAELQGKSLAPHVSRGTLFGIPSMVETQMAAIAAQAVASAEPVEHSAASRRRLLELAHRLGPRLIIGRADRYYIYRARNAGYDIPAYPFSRKGELGRFLADAGMPDVPAWYARIGVGEECYRNLAAFVILALRDASGAYRERLVAHAAMYVDPSHFVALEDDTLLEQAPADVLESLLDAVRELEALGRA